MSIDAMKQALEALERGETKLRYEAITALRAAIEQAEKQEPHELLCICGTAWNIYADGGEELVYTPPAAQRQPLTDDEIDDIWNRYCDEMGEASINDAYDIARAIEAAHGIGEKK